MPLVVAVLLCACLSGQADPRVWAGTCFPARVWEYQGGTTWQAISPDFVGAVLCLEEYEGDLYAGTISCTADWFEGRVYRHDGDGQWTLVGAGLDEMVCDLAVYRGRLYAGTAALGFRLYRYEAGTSWSRLVDYWEWGGVRALWVGTDSYLYLGDYLMDNIARFDGANLCDLAWLDGSCIWDFSEYGQAIYAAAWLGRMHRSFDGRHWGLLLNYRDWDLWELEQFQGYLHLGYDDGQLWRLDGTDSVTPVWSAPNSIIAMLADGRDRLYIGTGYEGSWGGYGSLTGVVYAYDGTAAPEAISGVLGWGVQCLHHPHTFPDIRCEHWAYMEVESCCGAEIVGGYPEGHYQPRRPVSRDQMAVFIARALAGGESNVPPAPDDATFADIPPSHWAHRHIEYACAEGVVKGYEDGQYHPEVDLTRDQMAVFIARAMCGGEDNVPDPPCDSAPFPDVDCEFWARRHIQYLQSEAVTGGYGDGRYHPEYVCTRDQMAVFIARAFADTM